MLTVLVGSIAVAVGSLAFRCWRQSRLSWRQQLRAVGSKASDGSSDPDVVSFDDAETVTDDYGTLTAPPALRRQRAADLGGSLGLAALGGRSFHRATTCNDLRAHGAGHWRGSPHGLESLPRLLRQGHSAYDSGDLPSPGAGRGSLPSRLTGRVAERCAERASQPSSAGRAAQRSAQRGSLPIRLPGLLGRRSARHSERDELERPSQRSSQHSSPGGEWGSPASLRGGGRVHAPQPRFNLFATSVTDEPAAGGGSMRRITPDAGSMRSLQLTPIGGGGAGPTGRSLSLRPASGKEPRRMDASLGCSMRRISQPPPELPMGMAITKSDSPPTLLSTAI